jgi:hypothetical protein
MKYEQINEFMEKYFADYDLYAQEAGTMNRMDQYWAPDIVVIAYMQLKNGQYPLKLENRKQWQDFLIDGHRNVRDAMTPREIIIDEKLLKVAALLNIKKFDLSSGKQLCDLDGLGYYTLVVENGNSLRIIRLDFFCGDPGTMTGLYKI